jgi:hypothetical protein
LRHGRQLHAMDSDLCKGEVRLAKSCVLYSVFIPRDLAWKVEGEGNTIALLGTHLGYY